MQEEFERYRNNYEFIENTPMPFNYTNEMNDLVHGNR